MLAEPISRLLFEHGQAVARDSVAIARTLQGFAVGLLFFSTFQLLTRTFYAMQDTRTPALVNLVAAVVNVGAALVYVGPLDLGLRGMALAHATSYVVGAGVLLLLLRRRLGPIDGARIARTAAKASIAAVTSAAAALGVIEAWELPPERRRAGAGSTGRATAIVVGVLVFLDHGTYPASRRGR